MSARQTTLVLVGILSAYALWGIGYIHRTSFEVDGTRIFVLWDDAMISMRYAANLRNGSGLVWNTGEEAVQGFSNLGITLLMAGLHWLPVGAFKISLLFQLINLGALCGVLWLTGRIARDLFEDEPAVSLCSVLATALCAPLAVWGLQGSDAGLLALWLLICVAALTRSFRAGRAWPAWLFPAAAAGLLLRLDAAIYCAAFLLLSLARPGDRIRRAAVGCGCYAVVVAALLGFGVLYYGDPLPNTYYLKATGVPLAPVLISGVNQFLHLWSGVLVLLPVAGFALVRHRRDAGVWLLAGVVGGAFVYTIRVGGDWVPYHGIRFVVPALPALLILSTAGAFEIGKRLGSLAAPLRRARPVLSWALALILAVVANPPAAAVDWFDPAAPPLYHGQNQTNAHYGLYFARYTAPDTRIGVHWGGISPYLSGRPAVDLLGKSDRRIAKMDAVIFSPGHSKWDWGYVLSEKRPDIIVIASRGLAEREDFRADYVRVANENDLPFYLRRDAAQKLTDPTARFFDPASSRPVVLDE